MESLLEDNRGFALILTILIVSLIVALTLQFNTSMRDELYGSANLKDGVRLGWVARSGFNYGCAVLSEDAVTTGFDSLNEAWADPRSLSSVSESLFEGDRFEVQVIDLSGKIPINRLVEKDGKYNSRQKDILTRFLSLEDFGLDPEEVGNLIDAIKDWIDPDDEITRFGAESAYYLALRRPYECRNGPIESLEELLFIRGITKELYEGTKNKPGISKYLTVYGNGRININTADPLVLRALSDQMDGEAVSNMIEYRENKENDLKDPKWYKSVAGMGDINIDDVASTESSYFRIRSEGISGTMRKRITGTVERKEDSLRILSWKLG